MLTILEMAKSFPTVMEINQEIEIINRLKELTMIEIANVFSVK